MVALSASVIGAGGDASQKRAVELQPVFLVHTQTSGSPVAKKNPNKATEDKNGFIARDAVALCVGIRCGAISSGMKLSSQAARSIG